MPYAQSHYPFENAEAFNKTFPADFIAEGLDQTRGWFYTLTVLAAALFQKPTFKNVIVNGIILAEDGSKMIRSVGSEGYRQSATETSSDVPRTGGGKSNLFSVRCLQD